MNCVGAANLAARAGHAMNCVGAANLAARAGHAMNCVGAANLAANASGTTDPGRANRRASARLREVGAATRNRAGASCVY